MRLKARLSVVISSSPEPSSTRAPRSPARIRSAALARLPIGWTSRLASHNPTATAAKKNEQSERQEDQVELRLDAVARLLQFLIFGHAGLRPRHPIEHPGVDEAADIEIGIDEAIEAV